MNTNCNNIVTFMLWALRASRCRAWQAEIGKSV